MSKEMKVCQSCNNSLPLEEFPKSNLSNDGYRKDCKDCSKIRRESAPPRMSLREAINKKCKECIYDPLAGKGKWTDQVKSCTSPDCPLFEVRPFR